MEAIPPQLVVVQTHCWHVPNPGKLSARELADIQCVILAIFQVLGVRRCYHGSCQVDIGELNTLRAYLKINIRREVIHMKKNIFSAIVVCINMMIARGNETITAQAASSCLSALWAPWPTA